jgi:superfamily II DNA or RNA helicase
MMPTTARHPDSDVPSWVRAPLAVVARHVADAADAPRPHDDAVDARHQAADTYDPAHAPSDILGTGPGDVPWQLGAIRLLPHQHAAARRLVRILREHHGALLADDVGLGKTFTALAVAHRYGQVDVLAPAALLPMWHDALRQVARDDLIVHSLHRFSQPIPPMRHPEPAAPRLAIIDEAHHLRSRHTRRYRQVAQWVAGADVLLLSATPVHNRPADLAHLFALFLGDRADLLDDDRRDALIVRRLSNRATRPARAGTGRDAPAGPPVDTTDPGRGCGSPVTPPPRITDHPPIPLPDDPATLQAILTLPPPLPARDGAAAGALIRLGLLRAWCSSDAALTHAIRRRRARGEALRQALQAGRHPTRAELQSWIGTDDSVQLGFAEFLAAQPEQADGSLAVVDRHLDALATLASIHDRSARGDAVRAAALRDIAARHRGTPVIAFAQYASTVQALQRALADIAGVGALTSRGARIASGATSRADALARFAPRAHGRPPPPAHQAITLLLATDLLAEGVNLQDAGVVVHLDLPWTDALRRQRVGRIARVGSPHAVVHSYHLDPPGGAARVLRLAARLRHKAGLARQLVGDMHADPRTRIATLARQLGAFAASTPRARGASDPADADSPAHARRTTVVAAITAASPGWLAVLARAEPSMDGTPRLVASRGGRASEALRHVVAVLESAVHAVAPSAACHTNVATEDPSRLDEPPVLGGAVREAFAQIDRLRAERRVRELLGVSWMRWSPAQRRAVAAIRHGVAQLPAVRRAAIEPIATRAEAVVRRAQGRAADLALDDWSSRHTTMPIREWLAAADAHPALQRALRPPPDSATPPVGEPADPRAEPVVALLLLVPRHAAGAGASAGYRPACPGSPSFSTSTAPSSTPSTCSSSA